jgi:maleate cis-trans isomerase
MCEVGCTNAEKAARELATAKVDVYAFAFTAGSFFRGAGWDQEIADRIEQVAQAPCVVTSTAAIDAFKAYEVKKVAVVSPYAIGNDLLKKFIHEKGVEVSRMEGLTVSSAKDEGRQGIETFKNLVHRVLSPEIEAVFVSCTNFATIASLDELERSCGKLVVSANQATFWATLRRIGVADKLEGFGRLLREK